jgi:predicted RNA binding protein YcfA (HicA-like mRNA interferase family)
VTKLSILSARKIIKVLENLGFKVVRQKGNHIQFKHIDGRFTTVPNHPGKDVGRGLLRKILRDIELSPEEFSKHMSLIALWLFQTIF